MEIKFKPYVAKQVASVVIFGIPFLLIVAIGVIVVQSIGVVPIWINFIAFPILFLIFIGMMISIGRVKNTSYRIDNKFITRKMLYISEIEEDIPVKQITNIDYSIGWLFDKIFGTGTIKVYTAGSSFADIVISDVRNVAKIYDDMNSILHLKKSATITDDGKIKKNVKSELVKRIKPDLSVVMIQRAVIPAAVMILVTLGGGIILLPFLAIGAFFTYKTYQKRYYDFYTDKLEYYDGFFTYNKKTVPMERITNISETQTLVDRIVGSYTIHIQTAGSAGAEVVISFVKNGEEIANDLKEVLKKHGRN